MAIHDNKMLTEEETLQYSSFLRKTLPEWEPSPETKEMLYNLGEFTDEDYPIFIKKFKDYYLEGDGKDKILYDGWEDQIRFWLKKRIEWKHEAKLKKTKINSSAILQIQIKDIDLEILLTKLKTLFPENINIHINK